ncbi:MAG: hypothetical protein DPW18_19830 [Chloroflexi bacterium]|nr:hypothetical protein [Chloroflexota bacterium]MDL1941910.1 hypothetical protein [Chloroflexi bacterium CFX2]
MKAKLPRQFDKLGAPPAHYSYLRHRRQFARHILLPIVLSALAFAAMIVWIGAAAFTQGGDVGRWAAISTIWVIIPMMLGGLILLAILIGLIYLLSRALGILPYYTGIAQDYVYKAKGYIVRGADLAVKPILAVNGWLETIKAFFERMTP